MNGFFLKKPLFIQDKKMNSKLIYSRRLPEEEIFRHASCKFFPPEQGEQPTTPVFYAQPAGRKPMHWFFMRDLREENQCVGFLCATCGKKTNALVFYAQPAGRKPNTLVFYAQPAGRKPMRWFFMRDLREKN